MRPRLGPAAVLAAHKRLRSPRVSAAKRGGLLYGAYVPQDGRRHVLIASSRHTAPRAPRVRPPASFAV